MTAMTALTTGIRPNVQRQEAHLRILVTFVMSLKDTWLGNFVARSDGETLDVVVVAALFVVSTMLPTAVTVVLLGRVSRACKEWGVHRDDLV
jgi:hypothetical protein